jgi:DegV family protein with EDD domain
MSELFFSSASHPRALNRPPSRVRIVADSASDILPSHARSIGIIVVPNRIVFDGHVLRDGVDISASQFYARLPQATGISYTEPAPPEDLYLAYQTAFRQGATDILSVHVSSRLSKVVHNALTVRNYMVGAPIEVLDSLQAGIGMWPAVIAAAHLARLGASPREIRDTAASILARTHLYFMVESLEFLRRSGRIGRVQGMIGTVLDVHPILTIQRGEVAPVETVRPRARALQRMCDLVLERGRVDSLVICGTGIEPISQMEALLGRRYAGTIQKTWLGPTLGVNTGPAIAIAAVVR